MTGLDLARELALLGAECTVSPTDDRSADAHRGWTAKPERWEELGRRLSAHLDIPDAYQESLCGSLGLSPTSYWLVMLCGAVEIFPDAARAMGRVAGDDSIRLVTPVAFARLLRSALGIAFTKALNDAVAGSQAERLGLVERLVDETGKSHERPLSQQPLRLTAGALKGLLGGGLDVSQPAHLTIHREDPAAGTGLEPAFVEAADGILADRGILCVRCGAVRAGRQLAMDLAAHRGEHALLVTASETLPVAAQLGRLRGALPTLDLFEWCQSRPFPDSYVRQVAELLPHLVVVVSQNADTGDLPAVEVEGLTWGDSQRIWGLVLEDGEATELLARGYRVSLEEARSAVRAARDILRVRSGIAAPPDVAAITEQVLAQGARRMEGLVTRLRTVAGLDALVAAPSLRQQLEDIVSWHHTSARVYDDWGLARHTPLGKGLACLFLGPPGTGKTFAAQCLATALHLNLYRVDLGQVISQHFDETEKALIRLFGEAESGHGILLFEGMDALLRKRSEAGETQDIYANVEVSYLLQQIESFNGVSILTACVRNSIDPDYLRRFQFVLEFPMPDREKRRKLWEQSLPAHDRLDAGIDLDVFVERFPLSGGSIHNIGVAASHLAAASPDGVVRHEHLVRATYRELEKAGLPRSRKDFGTLATYLDGKV